ncbi:hypothetical protein G647_03588 [Cladophialophora carrionii CBS 160.54]|uniref:Uncharacterized protein n=1 Tax=Cladophialophora carrionii CBS 160.54 TaxID=1279043 RepID=V9DBC9_9EURO|nr:uncharacterized protein G647_03588 [Cladophialophora carrionii CBS 160.54]ETI24219.1 hypothetical protein G647_03588 [Cladophialophora carrionii CBS 160.54]
MSWLSSRPTTWTTLSSSSCGGRSGQVASSR